MKNKIIGLVDDEDVFHWIMKKHVAKVNESCQFLSFYNGDEIFQYLTSSPQVIPDVLFLDLNMPVCNGWRFLENITNSKEMENIDIYIVSSSIDPEDKKRAKKFSIVRDFITKPVSNEFLESILQD